MKKTMMTLVLIAALGTVSAQNGSDLSSMPQKEKRVPDMAIELGLDAEQVTKATEVNLQFAKAAAQLKKAGLEEAPAEARLAVLRNSRDKNLEQILTPEQYKRMTEIRTQRNDQDAVPSPQEVK